MTAPLGALAQLVEQARLADARLALDGDAARLRPRQGRREPPRAARARSHARRASGTNACPGLRVHRQSEHTRRSGCRLRGSPDDRGRFGSRLPPCSRTPTEGAPCKRRATSPHVSGAGASSIARRPSSGGLLSFSSRSFIGMNVFPQKKIDQKDGDPGESGTGREGDGRRLPGPRDRAGAGSEQAARGRRPAVQGCRSRRDQAPGRHQGRGQRRRTVRAPAARSQTTDTRRS